MFKDIKRLYIEGNQMKQLFKLSVLYIVLGCFGFAVSFYIGKITQSTLQTKVSSLVTDLVILTATAIVLAILNWYVQVSMAKVKHRMNASFKTRTATSLIESTYDVTHSLAQGDIIGRMSSDTSSISSASSMVLMILKALIFLIVLGIGMIILDYRLAFTFLACLPVLFAFQYFNANKSLKHIIPWKEAMGQVDATAQDILNNRSTVKAFGLYNVATKWISDDLDTSARKGIKGVGILYIYAVIMIIVNVLPEFLVGIVGLQLLQKGQLEIGTLVTSILLCSYASTEINNFQNAAQNIPHLIASTSRIFPIWDAKKELSGTIQDSTSDTIVTFDNVNFAYPSNQETMVLKDLSFTIKKGEKVGIVGTSGSGKSSILKLLANYYQVSSGSIQLWDTDILEWDTDCLRSKIGLLSQNFYLFDTSIKQNLLYAKPDASDEEILEALRKAQLDSFVAENGIEYIIGEKGSKLSGGQRQRLSIARTLLQDSELCLFDEATSALDNQTEKEIQNILKQLNNQTQIVVAHRLSTISHMDKILVLDGGRIVEEGTHDELLALNGVYAGLYKKEGTSNENI